MNNSGHYYSYCKNNNDWYEYNDNTVCKVNEDNIITNKAYILFYQLKN